MSGDLRERVTIQAVTLTTDGQGGFTESWANIGTTPSVFARVRALSGRERTAAAQTDTQATHEVSIRYRADITSAHRLIWESKTLYPVGPWLNNDERGVLLTAQCREDAG